MAIKVHINNTTQNQPGQVTTDLTAFGNEGVYDIGRGDFQVTGTVGLSVDVAKGEAFVLASSYIYGTQDQAIFSVSSSATEAVAITSNSSGNPRIDLICFKVDTAATPGVQGVAAGSLVAVAGTPAATPAPPAVPANHLILAQVAVANGASVISNAEITDRRIQATQKQSGGWSYISTQPAYVSANGRSGVIRFASTDLTTKVDKGNRIRLKQGASYKYFLVTGINTTSDVTLDGGTDYALTTATITDVYFSPHKSPVGFPLSPAKWRFQVSDAGNRTSSITGAAWVTGFSMTAPIGLWIPKLSYLLTATRGDAASVAQVRATMATAANSETNPTFTNRVLGQYPVNPNTVWAAVFNQGDVVLDLTSSTNFYLNYNTTGLTETSVGFRGDVAMSLITFENAYL